MSINSENGHPTAPNRVLKQSLEVVSTKSGGTWFQRLPSFTENIYYFKVVRIRGLELKKK